MGECAHLPRLGQPGVPTMECGIFSAEKAQWQEEEGKSVLLPVRSVLLSFEEKDSISNTCVLRTSPMPSRRPQVIQSTIGKTMYFDALPSM